MRGLQHLQRAHAFEFGNGMAPEIFEALAILRMPDFESAGQLVGIDATFAAALHTRMPADWKDAALLASEHAARERQIHERLHVVDAEAMLGESHAVDPHRSLRLRILVGETLHVVTGLAR